MTHALILCSIVLLLCVASNKLLQRFGIPTLLIFLLLGMIFGSDGLVGIKFDNFELAKDICSIGLIFIMFYGGFGTSWKTAKPVAVKAVLMSTLGVVITAGLTGLFCYFVYGVKIYEALLLGSVVASTDAAAVFAILRSRKLNLKGGLAPLLEIESGSNDPMAFMLTIIFVTLINNAAVQAIPLMIVKQIVFGLLIGVAVGAIAAVVLKRVTFDVSGIDTIFVFSVAILSYSLADTIGGNGYLSVYLSGIILGNSKILNKRGLVHFFDGISWLIQIMLFFTLGLVAFPSTLPSVMVYAIPIAIFLIVIARPVAAFSILSWFKVPFKQQLFVSIVGLRGSASIVFAILAATGSEHITNDIFHIVFFVALLSVSIQGSIIPLMAKKLDLIDNDASVLKTFNDYVDDESAQLVEITINNEHPYCGKTIAQAGISSDILVVMIKRGKDTIVPNGSTKVLQGDVVVELYRKEFYDSVYNQ